MRHGRSTGWVRSTTLTGFTATGTARFAVDPAFTFIAAEPLPETNTFFKNTDTFGYIGQFFGYAAAKGKNPDGWITVWKSTGRIKVLSCDGSPAKEMAVKRNTATNVKAVNSNQPFKRCFEPKDDKCRGKSTGRKRLCKTCEFCQFLGSGWQEAEYLPYPNS